MRSRVATGPTGCAESIKALIRSDSSALEPGLSLLEFDFKMGAATRLDALGIDRDGKLALVVVTADDLEPALARLLDGFVWAGDQSQLLARLYAERGVRADRKVRGFLLSPVFTHAFLRRLELLTVEVVPCLAREVAIGEGSRRAIIESASKLFGLEPAEPPDDSRPFWPDGVLPPEEGVTRRAIPVVSESVESPRAETLAEEPAPDDDMPWPASPEERFPWEVEGGPQQSASGRSGDDLDDILLDDPSPAAPFETLTVEEMAEFERFERQRRERGRGSS